MKENGIKLILTGAIAAMSAYFGELFIPIAVLCVVMASDYCTGVISAWKNGELSSRTGWYGIVKKVCYMFAVGAGIVVDYICANAISRLHIEVGPIHCFGLLVTIWLILNELLSILENLDEIGVPLPAFLKFIVDRLLKKVNDINNGKDDNGSGV